jgi:hypothetical protein
VIAANDLLINIDGYDPADDARIPYNLQGDDLGLYFFGLLGKQLFHDSVFRDLIRINSMVLCIFLLWLLHQLKRVTKLHSQIFIAVLTSLPISLFFANRYFNGTGDLLNPWEGYLWVIYAPFCLLFSKGRSKTDFFMNVSGMILFAIFCSIRNSVLIFLIPLLAKEFWKCSRWLMLKQWSHFHGNPIKELPGLVTGITAVVFSKAVHLLTTESFRENYGSGHLVWHSIWCFLDIGNTSMPFKMSDSAANLRAIQLDPDIVFATSEYDLVLRSDVLSTLKMYPGYIFEVWAHKIELISGPILLVTMLTLTLTLIYKFGKQSHGINQLILIGISFTFSVFVVLITWPLVNYAFPIFFGGTFQVILILILTKEVVKDSQGIRNVINAIRNYLNSRKDARHNRR